MDSRHRPTSDQSRTEPSILRQPGRVSQSQFLPTRTRRYKIIIKEYSALRWYNLYDGFAELKCIEDKPAEQTKPVLPPATTISTVIGIGSSSSSTLRTPITTTTRDKVEMQEAEEEDEEEEAQQERILPVLPPAVQAVPSPPPSATVPPRRPSPPFVSRPTESSSVSPRLTSLPPTPQRYAKFFGLKK